MANIIAAQFSAKGPVEFGFPGASFTITDCTVNTMQTASSSTGDCGVGMRWFQAKVVQKGQLCGSGAQSTQTYNAGYVLECSHTVSFPSQAVVPVAGQGTRAIAVGFIPMTSSVGTLELQGAALDGTYQFVRVRFFKVGPADTVTYDAVIDAAP